MPQYRFERDCRTPYSEAYFVTEGDDRVGRVDIHFTPTVVYATLCVPESMTAEGIQDLIEVIDEELVMSAEVPREDFIISVFQGRDAGVYSDEILEEEEEEGEEEEEQP